MCPFSTILATRVFESGGGADPQRTREKARPIAQQGIRCAPTCSRSTLCTHPTRIRSAAGELNEITLSLREINIAHEMINIVAMWEQCENDL